MHLLYYIACFHELIKAAHHKTPFRQLKSTFWGLHMHSLSSLHHRWNWWNFLRDETWEVKSMLFISHRDIMPWGKRQWNIFSPGGYILLDILHTAEVGANAVPYLSLIVFQDSLSSVHANSRTHHMSYLEHLVPLIEPPNASCSTSVTIKHTVFIRVHSDGMCLTVGTSVGNCIFHLNH